ncbi:hypothetical protein GCM10009557_32260 [Virgisporangium ochraceum]|uniref:DNRLRE domain-containing protein n=1 Tax=Virgisporangium ochraceum TaxID=65505 RepID=A0A8J4EHI1_9ACTN|nr:hypothetical protein [Virgisporangium ochraceum]GIJ75009.1 hypothetical protein Voc01_099260 [Virgisporangium ochraceum]
MLRTRRALVCSVLMAVASTAVVTMSAAPAAAAGSSPLTPSSWAYVDSQAPRTTFIDRAGDAPVGTRTAADGRAHTYRSYFTFDLTPLRGHAIRMGHLTVRETAVTDCTVPGVVQLWRTSPIRPNTSWRNPPAEQELLRTFGGTASSCPGTLFFDLAPALNAAIGRGQTALTIELRIPADREGEVALGRTFGMPTVALLTDRLPVVSNLGLVYPDRGCGTYTRPTPANDSTLFRATVTDPDGTFASAEFSVWPAGRPEQRREFSGGTYGGGVFQASTDLTGFPEGSLVAWAARGQDHQDLSQWSPPCFLRIDRTAPGTAPIVASRVYLEGTTPSGGPGVKGRFWFSAKGDRDVVAYSYTDIDGSVPHARVAPRWPGGPVMIEWTPRTAGQQYLEVWPEDAAGNRGPSTRYRFTVRNTAPEGRVEVAGVGLPSRLTLTGVPEVTQFGYQLPGQAEVRFPAANGTGSTDVTFPAVGSYEITTRSYAGDRMIGSGRLSVHVDDAPTVTSAEFNLETSPVAGRSGSFTFTPRSAGVVAYLYSFGFGGTEQRVEAPGGTAVLPFTPPAGGWYTLRVRSVRADGSTSNPATHYFSVIDPHPVVYVHDLTSWPRRDGPGLPLQVDLNSGLPDVTGFVYRLNGGAEQTATASFGSAYVTVTPDRAGDNTLLVRAVLADGSTSPETEHTFSVWSGPLVTWTPAGSGVVDKPVTFTFHPALPGVVRYRYTFPGQEEQTVAAGPDGTASATYVPGGWGLHTIAVTSVGGDGTASETRDVYFDVLDNRVSVYGALDESAPRGGVGNSTVFQLYSQRAGEVVEYLYRVDDDPVASIPQRPDSTTTYLTLTLTRNGLNTLYVQSRTRDGDLSPVTEYRFLVGTAPYVVSAQYPEGTWGGGPGVEGTFEFSGGTPGIVSFDYRIDGGAPTTVAADADGRASITYTPTGDTYFHTLVVTGRKADGTTTDPRSYAIQVQPR